LKKYLKTIVFFIAILMFLLPIPVSSAAFANIDINKLNLSGIDTSKLSDLENTIEHMPKGETSIDSVLIFYQEISNVISNEEIVTFIENNKEVLSNAGLSKSLLNTSSSLFKNFDAETVIDVVKNNLMLQDAIAASEEGASADAILKSAIKKTPTLDKIKIIFKLLFSNGFIRLLTAFIIVISIYSIFITSYIFKKAGKPAYATAIPVYRDIIHLKLCNFSPWLLLLVFIPLIGWLALAAIAVVGRFELSRNFGHGFLFGLRTFIFASCF